MKKILLILAITLSAVGCNFDETPDVSGEDLHNCLPIPNDVPKTFAGGTPIEWDCEMQAFYVNGDLKFYYDSLGGLTMIEKVR